MDRLGKKPKKHFQMDFNTFQHFKGDHIRIGAKMNFPGGYVLWIYGVLVPALEVAKNQIAWFTVFQKGDEIGFP